MRKRLAATALAALAIVPTGGTALAVTGSLSSVILLSACGGEVDDDDREDEEDD